MILDKSRVLFRLSLTAGWLLAMALAFAPQVAHAATCTSTGTGNWSTMTWSGCTPGATDDVVIDSDVTLDVDVTVAGITINSGKTFDNGSNTLTASAGYLTNNGAYMGSSGTYAFSAGGGVYGASTTTFNNVTIAAGVDFQGGSNPAVVAGILTINAGGFVPAGKAPSYASGSTLKYSTGGIYTASEEWYPNTTSGPGVPHHVEISSGTTLTFGSSAFARTAKGNVTIDGTLTLSSAAGGDLNVGGNFTRSGVLTHNNRTVTMNGSSAQTIGGAFNTTFFNLTIDNSAGVTLSQWETVLGLLTLNNGNLNLGNQVLYFATSGGGILVNGARSINGPGDILFTGAKTISGGTLTFGSNVDVSLSAGVDFGAAVSTINGALYPYSGGFVNTNPPTYGPNSVLIYGANGVYNRGAEWSATSGPGYPNHVHVSYGGTLNYASGDPAANRIAGRLQIDDGTFDMGNVSSPLKVGGSVVIFDSLSLSTAPGGDLEVGANWQNHGTFIPNGRTVTFNGSGTQIIWGISGTVDTIFDGLTINNTSSDASGVTMGRNVKVNGVLTLTDGMLKVGSSTLTLGPSASVSGGSTASMVVTDADGLATGDGFLCKDYSGAGSFTFPVGDTFSPTNYSPATLDFSSGTFASGQACVRVTDAKQPDNTSTTNYLTRYWTATQTGISSFSADATFTYVDADVVGTESAIYTGQWDGATWTMLNAADTANNTIGGTVSSFSDFTGGEQAALAVTLASFAAEAQADRVVVTWETVSEIDNAGFNLYRTGSVGDRPEQGDLIATVPSQAPGSTQGAAYSFEDLDVQAGQTYWYTLEDVSLGGATTLHGPVSATVQAPTAVTLSGISASPAAAPAAGLAVGGRGRRRSAGPGA